MKTLDGANDKIQGNRAAANEKPITLILVNVKFVAKLFIAS